MTQIRLNEVQNILPLSVATAEVKIKNIVKENCHSQTSKMNFTNNRLTSLRICKLRAYFEKLIGTWSGCSGRSWLYDYQGSQGGPVNWVVRVV